MRYSAKLFEYVAEMIPSKSCIQKRRMIKVGTDNRYPERVDIHIPLATVTLASCVSSAKCAEAS